MVLIKSLSGVRGTIGGKYIENLTPVDILVCIIQFIEFIKSQSSSKRLKIVVGRDARKSGSYISAIVTGCLQSMGINVIDSGISTTPSIEMAVEYFKADGGIIITASHNPINWNALKFLNSGGQLLSPEQGEVFLSGLSELPNTILSKANFADVVNLGDYCIDKTSIDRHIQKILDLQLVKPECISEAGYKIVVDPINSSGAIAVKQLLKKLGVENIAFINSDLTGDFAHNPEPLAENLNMLSEFVIKHNADLGIAVDPDVDRLSLIDENGNFLSEEYTLVLVSDYILKNKLGSLVSNISSSLALVDLAAKYGCKHYYAKVGEANVVSRMKETDAIVGGEGNGGVIYPELHYGRDALVGIALILSYMASSKLKISALKSSYKQYVMVKDKIILNNKHSLTALQHKIQSHYNQYNITLIDGIRIDFKDKWVHLRQSNTEPIIRIYSEAGTKHEAELLVEQIKSIVDK
ncbi:MAG: phosphoglucosamine mutase [Solitalea-like symbiont of Tyrophagus putrescentiae]